MDSKRSTYSDHVKNAFEKIHRLLVTDIVTEKEKLKDFIRNNPYEVKEEDWTQVIEFAEREVRDRLNDPTLLKNPALRYTRVLIDYQSKIVIVYTVVIRPIAFLHSLLHSSLVPTIYHK